MPSFLHGCHWTSHTWFQSYQHQQLRRCRRKVYDVSKKLARHLTGWGKDMIRRTGSQAHLGSAYYCFLTSNSKSGLKAALCFFSQGMLRSMEILQEFPVMSDCYSSNLMMSSSETKGEPESAPSTTHAMPDPWKPREFPFSTRRLWGGRWSAGFDGAGGRGLWHCCVSLTCFF